MIHAVNDLEGRLPIQNRVQEIYTDYVVGGRNYADGDAFNRSDYNSRVYGQWEFFGIEFPASPQGVLVEAGGGGRGMFIGFNESTGYFVARGGSGANGTPAGCARLEIPPSTYDFAGKIGRLLVTIDPATAELTLGFDENNTGTFDYQASVTAAAGFIYK